MRKASKEKDRNMIRSGNEDIFYDMLKDLKSYTLDLKMTLDYFVLEAESCDIHLRELGNHIEQMIEYNEDINRIFEKIKYEAKNKGLME